MTDNKVLFFDIDGTLINFDGTIPESALKAMDMAKKKGHKLIVCTGRSKSQVHKILLDYGFDGYVCATGAYVEYEGKVVSKNNVEPDKLQKMADFFDKYSIPYSFQCTNNTIMLKKNFNRINDIFMKIFNSNQEQIDSIYAKTIMVEDLQEISNVEKAVYYDAPLTLEAAKAELGDYFEVTGMSFERADSHNGEITIAGVNKAYGMKKLLEMLGKTAESAVGFGDSSNDLDMLEYAGVGVAMGNSIPEILNIADYITTDVDKDGIYNAMKNLELI